MLILNVLKKNEVNVSKTNLYEATVLPAPVNHYSKFDTDFLIWAFGGGAYTHWILCGSQANISPKAQRFTDYTARDATTVIKENPAVSICALSAGINGTELL